MIASVLINDTFSISSFDTKQVANNVITLEYIVATGLGVDTITNVKLLDALDNVLTSATVYVPLVSDAVMKHTISIKEGV